ncbi:MAG: very short patch repair endonuclease [Candidatus Limnocylindrales bacterium]
MKTVAPPIASSARARAVMQGNRRRDTLPELRLRSELHRGGARFRVDYPVRGRGRTIRVDIAFPRSRIAVFVDGCFWHGCGQHPKPSKSHADYWGPKIAGNRRRDAAQDADLTAAGWRVIRSWEHERAAVVALRVREALQEATSPAVDAGVAEAATLEP